MNKIFRLSSLQFFVHSSAFDAGQHGLSHARLGRARGASCHGRPFWAIIKEGHGFFIFFKTQEFKGILKFFNDFCGCMVVAQTRSNSSWSTTSLQAEAAASFKEKFPSDKGMQDKAPRPGSRLQGIPQFSEIPEMGNQWTSSIQNELILLEMLIFHHKFDSCSTWFKPCLTYPRKKMVTCNPPHLRRFRPSLQLWKRSAVLLWRSLRRFLEAVKLLKSDLPKTSKTKRVSNLFQHVKPVTPWWKLMSKLSLFSVVWPVETPDVQDPVAKHFADAFQSLQGVDLATSKADAKGTLLGLASFGVPKLICWGREFGKDGKAHDFGMATNWMFTMCRFRTVQVRHTLLTEWDPSGWLSEWLSHSRQRRRNSRSQNSWLCSQQQYVWILVWSHKLYKLPTQIISNLFRSSEFWALRLEESFMVTAKEAEEVKALASKAKSGQDYDFSKLPADALQRLEGLYSSINTKAGWDGVSPELWEVLQCFAIGHCSDNVDVC